MREAEAEACLLGHVLTIATSLGVSSTAAHSHIELIVAAHRGHGLRAIVPRDGIVQAIVQMGTRLQTLALGLWRAYIQGSRRVNEVKGTICWGVERKIMP